MSHRRRIPCAPCARDKPTRRLAGIPSRLYSDAWVGCRWVSRTAFVLPLAAAALLFAGCGHKRIPQAALPAAGSAFLLPVNAAQSAGDEALPLSLTRGQLVQSIVQSLQKPVMGRAPSLDEVRRISVDLAPIVESACRLPALQPAFDQIARDQGISPDEARSRWASLQEADLLLESGGDADALSYAGAAGVAQWLPSTAQAVGLRVSLADSDRLTSKIDPLARKVAWLAYLSSPGADPDPPGAPAVSAGEARLELPSLSAKLAFLRAKRARLDTRYDPRQAIFAQTRYLLGLYNQIPSPDWIFQAYHGGTGGVERTLKKYLGGDWPGSIQAALDSRRPLSVEDVYLTCTPRSHPDAFVYLYDRGDDDRHYWWKLRAALSAIALYKKSPADFQREWEGLMPGRAQDVAWYPRAQSESFADLKSLKSAAHSGSLLPVRSNAWYTITGPPLDPKNAPAYETLRPQAKGALLLVCATYARADGAGRLIVSNLTSTRSYLAAAAKLHPAAATQPPASPPDPLLYSILLNAPLPNFDFHTTGLAFDIDAPHDPAQNRTLLYALGIWKDRQVIWWRQEDRVGGLCYHVVPNPRFRKALDRIALSGHIPALR